jgi:tetratricopeptide (TPR) repeat protein
LEGDLKGKRQLEALNEMEDDFENLRSAWMYAAEHRNEMLIDQSLESIYLMTRFRSKYADGFDLINFARSIWPTGPKSTSLSGRLLIRHLPPGVDPVQIFEQGLEIAEKHGNPAEMNYARNQLGRVLAHSFEEGKFQTGLSLLNQSLTLFQDMEDEFSSARVLDDLSFSFSFSDLEKKIHYSCLSVEIRRKIGDHIGLANSLLNLAGGFMLKGDYKQSKYHHQEGLEISRRMGDQLYIAWHSIFLMQYYILSGEKGRADEYAKEIDQFLKDYFDVDLEIEFVFNRILSHFAEERYEEAHEDLNTVTKMAAETGSTMHAWWLLSVDSFICMGLGDMERLKTVNIPLILKANEQISEIHTLLPFDLITPITAAMIDDGFYAEAANRLEMVTTIAEKGGIEGYVDRFPIYRKLISKVERKLGRRVS